MTGVTGLERQLRGLRAARERALQEAERLVNAEGLLDSSLVRVRRHALAAAMGAAEHLWQRRAPRRRCTARPPAGRPSA